MRTREGVDRGLFRYALALLSMCALAACSSSVTGHGSAPSSRRVNSSTPDFPSSTAVSSSVSAPSTSAGSSAPTGRHIVFTGTVSQRRYQAVIWASDTIRNCAAHAYGAPMIAFLQSHPCGPTHRVLATVYVNGRDVDVSSIATSFAGRGARVYVPTEQFVRLEEANGTGSINDLLREGASMPGGTGQIPAHEAFQVLSQDTGADVLDAWYQTGPTRDQDPFLLSLEQDLFLSRLTSS